MNEFAFNWMDQENIKTEQYIIGAIFVDSRCLDEVRSKIRPEMFQDAVNRGLFECACELQDEGSAVDIVTVGSRFKAMGGALPGSYLVELTDAACTASDVSAYCDIMEKEFRRRGLLRDLNGWVQDLLGGADPKGVAIEIADKIESYCSANGTKSDGIEYIEAVSSLFSRIEEIQEGKRKPALQCGYKPLDKILGGGFQQNGLYILAARPGKGKTAMALNLARNIAEKGSKVLFVSLEMDTEQLVSRIAAADVGRVSATTILNGQFDQDGWDRMADFSTRTSSLNIVFNRKNSMSVKDIRFMAKVYKPDFIVIDYLGLITNEDERGAAYEETTKKSKKLKLLARELGCPILCLAQLNRESEKRERHKPILSDLRDSGSIEQDADAVLFNWVENDREDYELPENQLVDPVDLKIVVAKNRHGRIGAVPMFWDKLSGKITELYQNEQDAVPF